MKYLKLFKNIKQYSSDKREAPDDYSASAVTYVLSNFNDGEVIKYDNANTVGLASAMWIDDYPSEEQFNYEFYGYSDFDDYLYDYFDDPESYGSNRFYYTDETVEYNGVTYYAWYNDDMDIYYLTNTINYNTLYNLSMEANSSNRNCPIYAMLQSDLDDDPYIKNYDDPWHILAKVEDDGGLVMWIDDFPTVFTNFYYLDDGSIETYDDYFDYLLNENPGGNYAGANKYVYFGETIEYDGGVYHLWAGETDYTAGPVKYVLTSTAKYNDLYPLSIEDDYSNRNCPIYAILDEDKRTYNVPDFDNENYVLLKVDI